MIKLTDIIKEETFTAINKDTGKVSVFKSKDTRDAAVKAGTHEKRDEKDSEDKNKSGNSVSGKNMFKHASDIKKQSGDTSGGEDSDTKKSDTSSDDSTEFTSIGNDEYKLKGQENDQSADVYTKREINLINKNPDVFNKYKPLGNGEYENKNGFIKTKDDVFDTLAMYARLQAKGLATPGTGGTIRQQSSQNSEKMKLNKGTLKTGGQTRTEPGTYMNPDTREWFVVVKGGGYLGPYKSSGEAEDAQVKYSSLDYYQQQALRGESITGKSIKENRWLKLKNSEQTPNQKIGEGIREINYQLREIEKFVGWYSRIKNENDLNSDKYWKRTTNHLNKIRERLMRLSNKMNNL